MHADVKEVALLDIFQGLCPINSIRICRDRVTRQSLGYGYINFEAVEDAERALGTMNYFSGPQTFGRPLRFIWSTPDPSLRLQGASNMFVKGLAKKIDCNALHDTFSQFGEILSCKIATDEKGHSIGYGFVHFKTSAAAKAAIAEVNGMLLEGEKVNVVEFMRRQEREAAGLQRSKYTNVYVKNLFDQHCSEDAQPELFSAYGRIISLYVPRKDDGTPKRYAFLNFATPEKAEQAVREMHGRLLPSTSTHTGTGTSSNTGAEADSYGENSTNSGQGENGGMPQERKRLHVCRAQRKSERAAELRKKFAPVRREQAHKREGLNVYVKNLHPDVDTDLLRSDFTSNGTITSCVVMRDARGCSRGFGFVCFVTKEQANRAVKLSRCSTPKALRCHSTTKRSAPRPHSSTTRGIRPSFHCLWCEYVTGQLSIRTPDLHTSWFSVRTIGRLFVSPLASTKLDIRCYSAFRTWCRPWCYGARFISDRKLIPSGRSSAAIPPLCAAGIPTGDASLRLTELDVAPIRSPEQRAPTSECGYHHAPVALSLSVCGSSTALCVPHCASAMQYVKHNPQRCSTSRSTAICHYH